MKTKTLKWFRKNREVWVGLGTLLRCAPMAGGEDTYFVSDLCFHRSHAKSRSRLRAPVFHTQQESQRLERGVEEHSKLIKSMSIATGVFERLCKSGSGEFCEVLISQLGDGFPWLPQDEWSPELHFI